VWGNLKNLTWVPKSYSKEIWPPANVANLQSLSWNHCFAGYYIFSRQFNFVKGFRFFSFSNSGPGMCVQPYSDWEKAWIRVMKTTSLFETQFWKRMAACMKHVDKKIPKE
jgi:hypothetical protein